MSIHTKARRRNAILFCLALAAALLLSLFTTLNAQANSVTIDDQSGVLDAGKVRAEASKLSYSILIFTTKTFSGDQDALDQNTRAQLPDQNSIAIGIDTVHRHLSIESGTKVPLSDSQASDAVNAFRDNFNGGDYTDATIAAIDSLEGALNGSSLSPIGAVIAVVLVSGFIGFIALVIVAARRRRPPQDGGGRRWGIWRTAPYYGGYYAETHSPGSQAGGFGGGAGGSFGGGFGGGSSGGGAGGSF